MKGERGHVRAECNFGWAGTEKVGQCYACTGYERIRLLTGWVRPVGVGIVVVQVTLHGPHYCPRDLSAAGPIEIRDRMSPMVPFQSREVRSYLREVSVTGWHRCREGHELHGE